MMGRRAYLTSVSTEITDDGKGRLDLQASQRRQATLCQQKGAHPRVRSGQATLQREAAERSRRSPCAGPSRLETIQPPAIRKDRYWKDSRGGVGGGGGWGGDL